MTDTQAPFIDALALLRAQVRHDSQAVQRVLDTADLPDLALVLSQMVQTAIRTQEMSLDQFQEMLTDKVIRKL